MIVGAQYFMLDKIKLGLNPETDIPATLVKLATYVDVFYSSWPFNPSTKEKIINERILPYYTSRLLASFAAAKIVSPDALLDAILAHCSTLRALSLPTSWVEMVAKALSAAAGVLE